MKWLKSIIDLILYSNFWIACCALAMVMQTDFVLSGQLRFTPLSTLVFFSTLFLYALHRIVGISKVHEFIADFERYQVIAKYLHHITVYAIIAAIGGAISFFYISRSAKLALILPGLVSLAYVIPFLKGKKRLRDYDHIKIYLIAMVWAFVSVLLPVIDQSYNSFSHLQDEFHKMSIWIMALEKALFIFTITLPFDIRDLKVDAHSGVSTIPSLIGIKKTQYLGYSIVLICLVLIFVNYQLNFYHLQVFLGLGLSYTFTALLIFYTDRIQHDYYYTGLVDGMMIIQFLLIMVMSLI